MKYIVKRNIWHTGDHCYYFPAKAGDKPTVVSMDHLGKERIEALVAGGIIEPVAQPKKRGKQDGTDN